MARTASTRTVSSTRTVAATNKQLVRDSVSCIDTGAFVGRATTAGNISLSGSALTIAAWIKPRAFQTGSPFISSIAGQEDGPDNNLALLRLSSGSLATNRQVNFSLKFGSIVGLTGIAKLNVGIWYHVAGVYDGTNMFVYVNGVQDGTVAQTGSFTANSPFYVSQSAGGGVRMFNGFIDDIRCYKRGLTATEISNLYLGTEPATTNLTIHYKCDEGSGTSLTDSSGNNSTGTLTSTTYSTDVKFKPRTLIT